MEQLLRRVEVGESAVQVLRGEAGVGKTALLDHLEKQSIRCHVVRVAGAQSEMELAYAGLHQTCAGMLDSVVALPAPQRDALRSALSD